MNAAMRTVGTMNAAMRTGGTVNAVMRTDGTMNVVESEEEGLVLKRLDSQWVPNERNKNWVKLKPDYLPTDDMDCLIVGGYYGTGRRGGTVAQWLLGVAEKPTQYAEPSKFLTFCRIGNGCTDAENLRISQHLAPYFKKGGKGRKPPAYLRTTGHTMETPHEWIDDPSKSLVVQVKGDIRAIQSNVFKSSYSLRFPRITEIRWDKPWRDVLTDLELVELVESAKNQVNAVKVVKKEGQAGGLGAKRRVGGSVHALPPAFARPDLSALEASTRGDLSARESSVLEGMYFYSVNYGEEGGEHDRQHTWQLVQAHGGRIVTMYNAEVTHILADHRGGLHYEAHVKHDRDVYSIAWVEECVEQGAVVPLRPKHRLHVSTTTAATGDCDEFGDSWQDEVDVEDVRMLVERVAACAGGKAGARGAVAGTGPSPAESMESAEPTMATARWSVLRGCIMRMVLVPEPPLSRSPGAASTELAERALQLSAQRLELAARLQGARIAASLTTEVTHVVVVTAVAHPGGGDPLLCPGDVIRSLGTAAEQAALRQLLVAGTARVVRASWVEHCVAQQTRAPERGHVVALTEEAFTAVLGPLPSKCAAPDSSTGGEEAEPAALAVGAKRTRRGRGAAEEEAPAEASAEEGSARAERARRRSQADDSKPPSSAMKKVPGGGTIESAVDLSWCGAGDEERAEDAGGCMQAMSVAAESTRSETEYTSTRAPHGVEHVDLDVEPAVSPAIDE
eukprot:gene10924-12923_t